MPSKIACGTRTLYLLFKKRKAHILSQNANSIENQYLLPKSLCFVEISFVFCLPKKKKPTKYGNPDNRREGSHCYSCSMQGKSGVWQNIHMKPFIIQILKSVSRVSNNNMVSFTLCLTVQFRLKSMSFPAAAQTAKTTPASPANSTRYLITNDIENETWNSNYI